MRYNALSPIMEKAVTEGGVHSFRGGGDHYSRVFGCRWDRRIRQAIAELQAASTGPAHWSARLKLFADNARHGARSLALSSLRITLLPNSNCGVERLWLMSASRQGDGVGIKHQLGAIVRLQFRVWHYAGANRKALRHGFPHSELPRAFPAPTSQTRYGIYLPSLKAKPATTPISDELRIAGPVRRCAAPQL